MLSLIPAALTPAEDYIHGANTVCSVSLRETTHLPASDPFESTFHH